MLVSTCFLHRKKNNNRQTLRNWRIVWTSLKEIQKQNDNRIAWLGKQHECNSSRFSLFKTLFLITATQVSLKYSCIKYLFQHFRSFYCARFFITGAPSHSHRWIPNSMIQFPLSWTRSPPPPISTHTLDSQLRQVLQCSALKNVKVNEACEWMTNIFHSVG